jgi:hypothetical protein
MRQALMKSPVPGSEPIPGRADRSRSRPKVSQSVSQTPPRTPTSSLPIGHFGGQARAARFAGPAYDPLAMLDPNPGRTPAQHSPADRGRKCVVPRMQAKAPYVLRAGQRSGGVRGRSRAGAGAGS